MDNENNEDVIIPEETPSQPESELSVDVKVAELEAHNKQLFERAKKAEAEAKANKALAEKMFAEKSETPASAKNLDVEDYIDISASLEGLDQREKEYLAQQHKMTGAPLKEIRTDENFELWQSAYRAKKEKEALALKPTGTQADSDAPKSFTERLRGASIAEKEAMLTEAGMYKSPRPRADRVQLGRGK